MCDASSFLGTSAGGATSFAVAASMESAGMGGIGIGMNGGGGVGGVGDGASMGGKDCASYEEGRRVPGTGDIYYDDHDELCEASVDFCYIRDGGIRAYRDPQVKRVNRLVENKRRV